MKKRPAASGPEDAADLDSLTGIASSKKRPAAFVRRFGWLIDFSGGWEIIGLLSISVSIFGIIGGIYSSRVIKKNEVN